MILFSFSRRCTWTYSHHFWHYLWWFASPRFRSSLGAFADTRVLLLDPSRPDPSRPPGKGRGASLFVHPPWVSTRALTSFHSRGCDLPASGGRYLYFAFALFTAFFAPEKFCSVRPLTLPRVGICRPLREDSVAFSSSAAKCLEGMKPKEPKKRFVNGTDGRQFNFCLVSRALGGGGFLCVSLLSCA